MTVSFEHRWAAFSQGDEFGRYSAATSGGSCPIEQQPNPLCPAGHRRYSRMVSHSVLGPKSTCHGRQSSQGLSRRATTGSSDPRLDCLSAASCWCNHELHAIRQAGDIRCSDEARKLNQTQRQVRDRVVHSRHRCHGGCCAYLPENSSGLIQLGCLFCL